MRPTEKWDWERVGGLKVRFLFIGARVQGKGEPHRAERTVD